MATWNQKRRTMRRYNQSAHVYDTQYSEEQEAKITTIEQNLRLKNNKAVLDLGCGSGLLIKHFADRTKLYVGADISTKLLKCARRKAKPRLNLALILADADNLPFPGQTFDAVFAVTLLQNMPHPNTTLAEINRVSKVRASLVITGLRKQFTQGGFVERLQQANMKIDVLKLDEGNREYVCICHKKGVKSKFSPELEYPPH
jgi:ubiquinone/menaquinone biosynthesis C-methylase UbiE